MSPKPRQSCWVVKKAWPLCTFLTAECCMTAGFMPSVTSSTLTTPVPTSSRSIRIIWRFAKLEWVKGYGSRRSAGGFVSTHGDDRLREILLQRRHQSRRQYRLSQLGRNTPPLARRNQERHAACFADRPRIPEWPHCADEYSGAY